MAFGAELSQVEFAGVIRWRTLFCLPVILTHGRRFKDWDRAVFLREPGKRSTQHVHDTVRPQGRLPASTLRRDSLWSCIPVIRDSCSIVIRDSCMPVIRDSGYG